MTSAPPPAAPATELASGVGQQVLDLAVALAPLAVPFILVFIAMRFMLARFGMGGLMGGGGGSPAGFDAALLGPSADDEAHNDRVEAQAEQAGLYVGYEPSGRAYVSDIDGKRVGSGVAWEDRDNDGGAAARARSAAYKRRHDAGDFDDW